jgi:hypothetical protein
MFPIVIFNCIQIAALYLLLNGCQCTLIRNLGKIADCLQISDTILPFIQLPERDFTDHYTELLNMTKKYRGLRPHHESNSINEGTWIENIFIDKFIGQPIQYFGGMVPLFVQWSDYQLSRRRPHQFKDVDMFSDLKHFLRHDVLYLAVTQANYGLLAFKDSHRNIVVLGAGGIGNVAIPLVKGNLQLASLSEFNVSLPKHIQFGFFGTVDHGPRKKILDAFRVALRSDPHAFSLRIDRGPEWATWM